MLFVQNTLNFIFPLQWLVIELYRIFNDFEETVRFANVYNRCIGFDAAEWHAANQFSQTNEEESRLTLIVFWHEISCAQTGLQRSEMEII